MFYMKGAEDESVYNMRKRRQTTHTQEMKSAVISAGLKVGLLGV